MALFLGYVRLCVKEKNIFSQKRNKKEHRTRYSNVDKSKLTDMAPVQQVMSIGEPGN